MPERINRRQFQSCLQKSTFIQDAETIILLLLAQRKGWLEVDPEDK
jgi:hypothetical protein